MNKPKPRKTPMHMPILSNGGREEWADYIKVIATFTCEWKKKG